MLFAIFNVSLQAPEFGHVGGNEYVSQQLFISALIISGQLFCLCEDLLCVSPHRDTSLCVCLWFGCV